MLMSFSENYIVKNILQRFEHYYYVDSNQGMVGLLRLDWVKLSSEGGFKGR